MGSSWQEPEWLKRESRFLDSLRKENEAKAAELRRSYRPSPFWSRVRMEDDPFNAMLIPQSIIDSGQDWQNMVFMKPEGYGRCGTGVWPPGHPQDPKNQPGMGGQILYAYDGPDKPLRRLTDAELRAQASQDAPSTLQTDSSVNPRPDSRRRPSPPPAPTPEADPEPRYNLRRTRQRVLREEEEDVRRGLNAARASSTPARKPTAEKKAGRGRKAPSNPKTNQTSKSKPRKAAKSAEPKHSTTSKVTKTSKKSKAPTSSEHQLRRSKRKS